MNNKRNGKKTDRMNLLFSAFLVTAFMVCASFIIGMIHDSFSQDFVKQTLLTAVVFVLFGLMLFYATRVGEGKQVFRFSPSTLILMVLPAVYVILATVIGGMPFHDALCSRTEIASIAGVILGYGIPYTFLSGYEMDRSEVNEAADSMNQEPTAQTVDDTTDTEESSVTETEESAQTDEAGENEASEEMAEIPVAEDTQDEKTEGSNDFSE